MKKLRDFIVLFLLLGLAQTPGVMAQGLIVNEVSNGPSGAQEFIEFVVTGPTLNPNCGPIDIRGWMFDDNNGDFSCGACAGTGIATGHQRFANVGVWAAVPTGSIIVIYDPALKNPKIPADDPNDTAPADGVYILSSSHASLEVSVTPCGSGNMPTGVGACASCSGVSSYAGACYTAGLSNVVWGLRNAGDAAQVRTPTGAYFHGISYGTPASLITGGPDNLLLSPIDGTGRFYAFTNSSNNNFRAVANFAVALVSSNGETPGAPNSANNQAWLLSLASPCPLPVNYYHALSVEASKGHNLLAWTTATEVNSDRWDVMRTYDLAEPFAKIGTVDAYGTSHQMISYTFTDVNPEQSQAWYQLRQHDINGSVELGNVVQINNTTIPGTYIETVPNPSNGLLHLRIATQGLHDLQVVDMIGHVVYERSMDGESDFLEMDLDLSALPAANYWLYIRSNQGPLMRRISIVHAQ